MKFQIFVLMLVFSFAAFVRAQDVPSEAEQKAVLNYIQKYNELEDVINVELRKFSQMDIARKVTSAEITAARKVHAANINEAIKNFTLIPVPSACKEIRIKMLAAVNCTKIYVNKTVNNFYEKQANKQSQCTNCKEAQLLAFRLKQTDPETQKEQYLLDISKMLQALADKYNFTLIDQKEQHQKIDLFDKGRAYIVELMFITDYFIDAHIEVVTAINNRITNPATNDALAKAISKYQNECATGRKLLLDFPNNFNGDGSLWKVSKELADFTDNFGQKTLPAMLAAFSKPNSSTADNNIIKAGLEEYGKAQPLIDKATRTVYSSLDKLLEIIDKI
jgi:hypothetical protein